MQAEGLGQPEIVTAATKVAGEAAGQPYTWGGHSTKGFDCSGFVIYVLRQAKPDAGFAFMTAAQIFGDRRFESATPPPQPGDLICFPKGSGMPHDHVGIVTDAGHWIGSQSSTGVASVSFTNAWWSKKTHYFLRLK
jgi:cell wall-associated NlpC family hydrolase